jgi:hypothetical protein
MSIATISASLTMVKVINKEIPQDVSTVENCIETDEVGEYPTEGLESTETSDAAPEEYICEFKVERRVAGDVL